MLINKKIEKPLSFVLLFGLLIFVILFSFYINFRNKEINSLYPITTVNQPLILKEEPITLVFVGDIMLNRGVKYMVEKYGKGDWKFPFLKIADFLQKADILFGNLENPISDKGQKVGSIYSFRANPEVIKGLKFAGFDILSVANNHIFDYGREAMEDTFSRLKKAGIDFVGGGFNEEEAYSPRIKKVKGTKIAFLAFTNLGSEYWSAKGNHSGIAWLTAENLKEGIKKAKGKADLVIVSVHFGEEYSFSPTPEQKYFAHLAINSGADLVIGHHPHVVQGIEKYPEKKSEISNGAGKNGYIAYSLGNFVFDQSFSEETMKGLMLKVLVKDAKIKEIIPIKIKINQYFQPEIVAK